MGIDKNLVQGSMALLLLRLLETKDMYGYEMIEALRSKSNNVFELKAGTLYPLLPLWRARAMCGPMRMPLPGKNADITS